ncbi:MAG: S-layer homology domain-containing protein [Thermoanaerobaculaceae bacterium]
MSWRRGVMVLLVGVVALGWAVPQAVGQPVKQAQVIYPERHDVSIPLRDMAPLAPKERAAYEVPNRPDVRQREASGVPGNLQTVPGAPNTPDPSVSWAGLDVFDDAAILGYYLMPPDTQGDIGKDHYIQWINSIFVVWDKTGTKVYPTTAAGAAGNTLWQGFGGQCELQNDGDPITLWDPLAERWVMSQFAVTSTPYQCVAVSTTSDPTGTWNRYAYAWPGGNFNDYPKLGVWPDAYYITTNNFNPSGTAYIGVGVGAFDRAAMVAGSPTATFVYYALSTDHYSMLPPDMDGLVAPPVGAPGVFAEFQNAEDWSPPLAADQVWLFNFHVDWANPANSTFGVGAAHDPDATVNISAVGYNCSGRDCIPQPGTTQKLDDIDGRLMHRLAYRNFGSHQSLVASMTVGASGRAGVWWGEIRDTGSGWSLFQDGVYAPSDTVHRWMPSIAQDTNGNIMMVYSASDGTSVNPSVRYVGRLSGDTLGTMGDEKVLSAGATYQRGGNRWGDYSMISTDPTDDCTFWMTGENVLDPPTGSVAWNWNTYVGAAKFPSCSTGPTGMVMGYVKSAADSTPLQGALVQIASYSTTTNASGYFQITIPVGTGYTATASKFGYDPFTTAAFDVTDGGTVDLGDILLNPVGSAWVDGYVTDVGHGFPLYSKITITRAPAVPVGVLYNSPWTGYYEVELPQGYTYDFKVEALVPEYKPETRPVALGPLDQTQNFSLQPTSNNVAYKACKLVGGLNEPFDTFPPEGWTVANLGGTCVWQQGTSGNLTGGAGSFAVADSDACGSGTTMNTTLTSPVLDLTGVANVGLQFNYDYYHLGSQAGYVEISTNGGTTWSTIKTFSASDRGPKTFYQDLTAQLGNQANARIRFRYVSPGWNWWWQVDTVQLVVPPPPPPAPVSQWVQNFDGVTTPALPSGWAQVDTSGTAGNWATATATVHPSGQAPHSGANLAYFNSYTASSGNSTRLYKTTGENLSSGTGYVRLWMYHDTVYTSNDRVQVQYSTNGGTTWTNIGATIPRYTGSTGWAQHEVVMTGVSGASVLIGLNGIGAYGNDTHIDDVEFLLGAAVPPPVVLNPTDFSCPPVPGGVVAGFVNDGNDLMHYLNGAKVENDLGAETLTWATPDDPAVNDGFYWMFTPVPPFEGPSTRTFTASASGFSAQSKDLVVTPNAVSRLDFTLESGWLTASPENLYLRVTAFGTGETSMTLENQGGLDAEFTLIENLTPPAVFAPIVRADNRSPWRKPRTVPSAKEMDRPGTLTGTPEKGNAPGAWGAAAPIPTGGRYAGAGMSCDGQTYYVFGGDPTGGTQTNESWQYDPATDSWTALAPMPKMLTNISGACIDGIIYLVGGYDGAAYTNDFFIYDIGSDSWSSSTWPRAAAPAVAAFDGKLYTIGGGDNVGDTADTWMYDPATGTWNGPMAPMPTPRANLACTVVGDYIYVIGGWGFANVERYDPVADSWSVGPALPAQRQRAFAAWYGDYLFVGGGGNGASWTATSDVWYYNPADWPGGSWTPTDTLAYATLGTSGACVNNRIYEVGGVGAGPAVIANHQYLDKGYECQGYTLPDIPWLYENPFEGIVPSHSSVNAAVGFETAWEKTNKFGLHLASLKIKHNTAYTVPNVGIVFTKAFKDVADDYWADDYIHGLAGAMITYGLPGGYYDPEGVVTRGQMATFLVRGVHGPLYKPPMAIGIFPDVTPDHWAADYIEQLYADEITTGCGGGMFCPERPTTRAEMAVFIVRAVHGPGFVPPAAVGIFPDVPTWHWAAAYIEQQYNDGITTGCGGGLYCPERYVTRAEMAGFLVRGFNIPYLH